MSLATLSVLSGVVSLHRNVMRESVDLVEFFGTVQEKGKFS